MSRFSASVFIPKKTTPSKLTQCVETSLPIFARDVGDERKKTFFACGYEYFCDVFYRRMDNKHVYEVLRYELPTKIYMDFDRDIDAEDAVESFNAEFNSFMNTAVEAICELFPDVVSHPSEVPAIVMDSTSETKLSKHVIIQFTLENVPAVKQFVEYVLSKCPCDAVDTLVYTRHRLFRVLYSTKKGKDTPLTIQNVDGGCASYQDEHVFATLIQCITPPGYAGKYVMDDIATKPRRLVLPNARKRPRESNDQTFTTITNIHPGIQFYIESIGCRALSARMNGDFLSIIVRGSVCPHAGCVHKSNNAYFTLNTKYMSGWWTCADDDCPKTHYNKACFKWIL